MLDDSMKANTSLVLPYRKDVSSREFYAACETNIDYGNSIKLNEDSYEFLTFYA